MKVLAILSCLVALYQFHGTFCDGHQMVEQNSKSNKRTKRYHESDCQKRISVESKQNKTASPTGRTTVEQKPKTTPKPVNKSKLPINERNEPKDVRTINHILEEIAEIAHNDNATKGIHKIRHLVDEIDNIDKTKSRDKVDDVKTTTRAPANKNEAKPKETTTLTQQCKTVRKVPDKESTNHGDDENKGLMKLNENKTLSINGKKFNNELSKHADETTRTGKPNDNLIEIEEHKYEEELLRSPYKYNTYNLNTGQNYNAGPMPYAIGNGNIIDNDNSYSNNYPAATYGQYDGNNGYYYTKSLSPSNLLNYQNNGDYTRSRKTWLDKDTVISTRNPDELGKIINEDRKEITNIQSPEFYRKYYSVTQKQYSNNNEVLNRNEYYVNPYQCDK